MSEYYAIIPANVRYDRNLKANEKLLYGEITALCNKKGYCWANNDYFSKLYNVGKNTISIWIQNLIKCGYIYSNTIKEKGNIRYLSIVTISENNDTFIENSDTYIEKHGQVSLKTMTGINENNDTNDAEIPTESLDRSQDFEPNNTLNNTNNITTNNIYTEIYDHYQSKENLKNHRALTKTIQNAINKAMREAKLTVEDIKMLIDRHNIVVGLTKENGKYKIRARPLQEFLGQKSHLCSQMICEEYDDNGKYYVKYIKDKDTKEKEKENKNEYLSYEELRKIMNQ